MPETSKAGAAAGARACQACRSAKVRCDPGLLDTCKRCLDNGSTCVFLPSRRGRVKGSKNRKTLERLKGLDDSAITFDPFWTRTPTPTHEARHRDTELALLEKTFPTDRDVNFDTAFSGTYEQDLQNPLLFLAECARKGWDSTAPDPAPPILPAPNASLPDADLSVLHSWRGSDLQEVFIDQRNFFQHGLHGSKRDVGEGLDAVQRNVIREDEVQDLFDAFYRFCHSQWPILDSTIHTPAYVRIRSAYLFTVILAIGATAIATLPGSPAECRRAIDLHAHVERLQLVLLATAAKSIEIIQAEQLLQSGALRKSRLVDDQRWARLGMSSRLSVSIGLQRSAAADLGDALGRNSFRLRLGLILGESRWESIADRKPVPHELLPLSALEEKYLEELSPFAPDALLAAEYALHCFETASKERLARQDAHSLLCERVWIFTFLKSWQERWSEPQHDPLRRWHFDYAALRSKMIGLLRIANAHPSRWSTTTQKDMLDVAIQLLQGSLSHERATHMLRTTSSLVLACAIVLQLTPPESPHRDLVLRLAMRLAGRPGEGVLTFTRHNGFQLINMLCLSKETQSQRQRASPLQTDFRPIERLATYNSHEDGIADLEQLLSYTGNIQFPYIPDPTLSLPMEDGFLDEGFSF